VFGHAKSAIEIEEIEARVGGAGAGRGISEIRWEILMLNLKRRLVCLERHTLGLG
jgi:hypothetical protein